VALGAAALGAAAPGAAALGAAAPGAMAHAAAVWPGFTMWARAHYEASFGG